MLLSASAPGSTPHLDSCDLHISFLPPTASSLRRRSHSAYSNQQAGHNGNNVRSIVRVCCSVRRFVVLCTSLSAVSCPSVPEAFTPLHRSFLTCPHNNNNVISAASTHPPHTHTKSPHLPQPLLPPFLSLNSNPKSPTPPYVLSETAPIPHHVLHRTCWVFSDNWQPRTASVSLGLSRATNLPLSGGRGAEKPRANLRHATLMPTLCLVRGVI